MAVYVDSPIYRYGRMIMCHMAADTEEELHEMAGKIGVARKWYQGDHYDICKSKRRLAIERGALEVSPRDIVRVARQDPGAGENAE